MKAEMLDSSARVSARSVVGVAVQCPSRPKVTSAICVSGMIDTAQRSGPIGELIVSNMAPFPFRVSAFVVEQHECVYAASIVLHEVTVWCAFYGIFPGPRQCDRSYLS